MSSSGTKRRPGAPGPASVRTDPAVLADVARRYYLEDASKVDVGRALGLSRFKVARLLDEARARGVVTITVDVPAGIDEELSASLAPALGIESCTVVRGGGGGETRARRDVAAAAAHVLPGLLRPGDKLGVTWSRTVDLMVKALTWLPVCTVVQLAGTQHLPAGTTTIEVARRAAELSGGRAYPVHAPLVLDDPVAAAVLRRHPAIADTLAMADDLDVAVLSVGAWRAGCSTVWDAAAPALREQGLAAGAIAEVSGRLLDVEGRAVATDLDDMVVGASLAQLSNARRRVALVAGQHRAPAVRAAVRAGLVSVLVTTAEVAHDVLRVLPTD